MAAGWINKEILARIILGVIIIGVPLGVMVWGESTIGPGELIKAAIPENGGWNPAIIKTKVGQTLSLRFISEDVVHGFAVGKQDFPEIDVLPGEITHTSLVFSEPGRYVFYCTRWCSPNHWRMRGTIIVGGEHTVEQDPDPPLYVVLGLDIDQTRQTVIVPDLNPSIKAGQEIILFLSKAALRNYLDPVYLNISSPVEVWTSIRGESFSDDLTDQDIWNMVAAIWMSNATPESLRAGERLYGQYCDACHGNQGDGAGVFAGKYSPGEIGSSELLMEIRTPADFTKSEQMLATSSTVLEGKILRGGMGTGMPNFGPILSKPDLWALIDYIWLFQFSD